MTLLDLQLPRLLRVIYRHRKVRNGRYKINHGPVEHVAASGHVSYGVSVSDIALCCVHVCCIRHCIKLFVCTLFIGWN